MTFIAESEGDPFDINILDLVYTSKAFVQIYNTSTKTTVKPDKTHYKRP